VRELKSDRPVEIDVEYTLDVARFVSALDAG
jgi:hypothetical protein